MDNNQGNNKKGIFSTPDLSVDAENIIPASTQDSTKNRVASIFANTDATKQAQQLNSSLSTVDQDVIIPSPKRRPSRSKSIIIAIIAITVIAIAGLTIWFVTRSLNKENPPSELASVEEMEKRFNNFATYVLFGESRNTFNEPYEATHNYKLSEEYAKEPVEDVYWNKSTELLDATIAIHEKTDKTQQHHELLLNYLQSYKSKFNYLKTYRTLGDISEAQLISKYSLGMDEAQKYVETYYEPLLDAEFYEGQELMEQKIAYYELYLKYIQISDKNGCIKNNQVTQECTVGEAEPESIDEYLNLISEINMASNTINSIALDIVDDLETQCWVIRDIFVANDEGINQDNPENEE